MQPDNELNPTAILAMLGLDDIDAVTPVYGGADTAIWRIEHQGRKYALRVFRPEQGPTFRREIAAMHAAAGAEIPVPELHAEGIWHDRPVLLLSWCQGQPIGQFLQRRPWRLWSLGVAFGRVQASIHTIPAPQDWPQHPTAWIEWAGSSEKLLQAKLRSRQQDTLALLHLDYHPLNVMTDGQRITGVLDWANASIGDPRADFARTYTILRVEPYGPGREPPHIRFFRWAFERGWRHGYQQVLGSVQDMAIFYAWAGAVMVRDLAPRLKQPGSWWQPHHLDQIRRWTEHWRRRTLHSHSPDNSTEST